MRRKQVVAKKVVKKKVSKGQLAALGGLALLVLTSLVWCGKMDDTTGVADSAASAPVAAGNTAAPPSAAAATGSTPVAVAAGQARTLAILPEAPTAGDPLMAVFQGTSGRVEYRWEKDGQSIAGQERDRLSAEHFLKGDIITAIVDNDGVRYDATVTIGNIPPVVSDVSFKNPVIHRGVDIELQATGDDADGDSVSFAYAWYLNDQQLDFADGAVLTGDRFSRGDQVGFRVIPFDGAEQGESYEGQAITIPNAPPVFVTSPPLEFLGDTYSYRARAEDPDRDEITYALENPPPSMTINSKTGEITWGLNGLPDGDYHIAIVAQDSEGQKAYQEYTFIMARQ